VTGWRKRQIENLMFQKHQYVRSQKLLKAVCKLDCQCCGAGGPTQAAHSNWGGGKGKGIKADDNLTAALCLKCHYEIDQGKNLTKEERQEKWLKAHKKTVALLLVRGEWPENVPVPQWDA